MMVFFSYSSCMSFRLHSQPCVMALTFYSFSVERRDLTNNISKTLSNSQRHHHLPAVRLHVCAVCVCGYITSPRVSFWGWATAIKRKTSQKKKKKLQEREWDNVKSRSFRIFTSTVFIYKDESLKTKWFPPRCSYLYNVSFRFFESIKILLLLLLLLVATGIPQRHSISN